VLTCYMTDKSRDLIRLLPGSLSLRPSRLCRGFPTPLHSRLCGVYPERAKRVEWARNDKTRDWNGNAYCARENLANTTRLIFMPESYPCYPFNPRHGEQAVVLFRLSKIVASLAPKQPPK
jgi:hypothetical protein